VGRGKLTSRDFVDWRKRASITPSLRKSGCAPVNLQWIGEAWLENGGLDCGQNVPTCARCSALATFQMRRNSFPTLEAARAQYRNLVRFGALSERSSRAPEARLADNGQGSFHNRIASEAQSGLRALIRKTTDQANNSSVQPDRGRILA
jgi:hypothetical protein